jgi:hypothetical protein
MFKATWDPWEGSFIDGWVYVLIFGEEGAQHVRHARPKHLSGSRGTGNVP